MTPAALLASARSLIEGNPAAVGLIDSCDLIDSTLVDGGATGDTTSSATIATNQSCMHEELSGPDAQIIVGGKAVIATHRIFMVWSAAAKALTERGKIKIAARDPNPLMTFQSPKRSKETFGPLAEFKAVLVTQGYQ